MVSSTIDILVGSYQALSDSPPAIRELSSALAELNEQARRTAQSSLGVYETLFAEENYELKNSIEFLIENLFNQSFDFDPSEGLEKSAETIQDFFILLQQFDQLMSGSGNAGSQANALSRARSFFNMAPYEDVNRGDLLKNDLSGLNRLGRDLLADFQEIVGNFRSVFGDFSFTELGEDLF